MQGLSGCGLQTIDHSLHTAFELLAQPGCKASIGFGGGFLGLTADDINPPESPIPLN